MGKHSAFDTRDVSKIYCYIYFCIFFIEGDQVLFCIDQYLLAGKTRDYDSVM